MPRYFRGPTPAQRPIAATIAFIAVGVVAAIGTAALAVGLATGVIPVLVAILGAAALAFSVFGVARLVELAQRPYPISLDCRDGRHEPCLLCGCACHKES